MSKAVVLFFLLFSINSYANLCAHNCHVFSIDDSDNPVLAMPKSFLPLGGHSASKNEMCVTRISLGGEILTLAVNDIFGREFALSIRKGSQLLASGNFSGSYGSLSLYSKKLRLTCSR